ncbi:hypothetical protein [Roseibium alexandrii]|uniref:hypothetical protein n=1 Tax=Roseibium alexandrii TaxID=388408 RepID=UPI003753BCD0
MRTRLILTILGGAAAVWLMDVGFDLDTSNEASTAILVAGAGKALAQAGPGSVHGTARRTSRRTTRRVARRTSVAGCTPYRAYYNCGGVYYQAVQESGTTIYVVVNP